MTRLAAAVVAITAICLGLQVSAANAGPLNFRTDALITTESSPFPIGNDIYTTDGAGESLARKVAPGKAGKFEPLFQNDGTQTDGFLIKGCASTGKFKVSYAAVGHDITSKMVAGTFHLTNVATGFVLSGFLLTIKASKNAKHGHLACAVTMTSDGDADTDTVVASVSIK